MSAKAVKFGGQSVKQQLQLAAARARQVEQPSRLLAALSKSRPDQQPVELPYDEPCFQIAESSRAGSSSIVTTSVHTGAG